MLDLVSVETAMSVSSHCYEGLMRIHASKGNVCILTLAIPPLYVGLG
jgi:hypothetical protein